MTNKSKGQSDRPENDCEAKFWMPNVAITSNEQCRGSHMSRNKDKFLPKTDKVDLREPNVGSTAGTHTCNAWKLRHRIVVNLVCWESGERTSPGFLNTTNCDVLGVQNGTKHVESVVD